MDPTNTRPANAPPSRPRWQVIVAVIVGSIAGVALALVILSLVVTLAGLVFVGLLAWACSRH